MVKIPLFTKVLYIQGGAEFLPSTVSMELGFWGVPETSYKREHGSEKCVYLQ